MEAIYDKIKKRFQFDLEMGRFNYNKNKIYEELNGYYFKFNTKLPLTDVYLHLFNYILKKLEYKQEYYYSRPFEGIFINYTNKTYYYYNDLIYKYVYGKYKPKENKLPNYIKEILKNGR